MPMLFDKRGRRLLHSSTTSLTLRDIETAWEIFPVTEQVISDDEAGFQSITQHHCYQAACSHLIYSPAQLAGRCDLCGGTICDRCLVRCTASGCFKLLCPDHLRIDAATGRPFCPACAIKHRVKNAGGKLAQLMHSGMSEKL